MDIQSIGEVEKSLRQFGVRYTHRLFTDFEIEEFNKGSGTPSWLYAERFAVKEAVFKTLNLRAIIPSWTEIEVRRKRDNQLELVLYGAAVKLAEQRGFRSFSASASHTGSVAIAVAVAR